MSFQAFIGSVLDGSVVITSSICAASSATVSHASREILKCEKYISVSFDGVAGGALGAQSFIFYIF